MATQEQCEQAVQSVVDRLSALDPEIRRKYAVSRTLSCRVSDLAIVFSGTLNADGLEGVRCDDAPPGERAQVRATTSSDDLIEMVEGRLSLPSAWASGRVKIEAGVLDLLRLRALL